MANVPTKKQTPTRLISRHKFHHQFERSGSQSVSTPMQQFSRHGAVAWLCSTALIECKPYPLSRQGFYGSLTARGNLRGFPRDGRAMGAKHPVRNPAKCLTSYPRNVPAKAGQWQKEYRRTSVKTTRKTTCLAPDLAAQCPRRKLARRLATWPRNGQRNISQAARGNFAVSF